MKAYGNLINRILENTNGVPIVGMGATIYWWSDRTPGTVVNVSPSGKTVTIREDDVVEWKDHYGVSYRDNPNGRLYTARRRKDGTWKAGGNGVSFGRRAAYRDPSF